MKQTLSNTKPLEKILFFIISGLAALFALWYAGEILFVLLGCESLRMILIAGLAIVCLILPPVLYLKLRARFPKVIVTLGILFSLLVLLFTAAQTVYFVTLATTDSHPAAWFAEQAKETNDTGKGTAVIVFGCHLIGEEPGRSLEQRLKEAEELLKALPDAICVVSGGQGYNENATEASAMKKWLVERGIDAERILPEETARSTYENIIASMALLEKLPSPPNRLIALSTDYHMARISLLARDNGYSFDLCEARDNNFGYWYVARVREFISFVKLFFFKDDAFILWFAK